MHALASSHDLLTRGNWEPASLRESLIAAVTAATGEDVARFAFDGPPVALTPQIGVSLALTIHELCTNAIKYGALSVETGTIAVDWHLREDDAGRQRLTIEWREQGGPPVTVPERKGFGSRLIEQGFVIQHDGSALLDYRPDGLCCTIELELPATA